LESFFHPDNWAVHWKRLRWPCSDLAHEGWLVDSARPLRRIDLRHELCRGYLHGVLLRYTVEKGPFERKMLLTPGLPGALFFKLQKNQILKFQKNI
jgi:hypothetical protein